MSAQVYTVDGQPMTLDQVCSRVQSVARRTLRKRLDQGIRDMATLSVRNIGTKRSPWGVFDPGVFSAKGAERTEASLQERIDMMIPGLMGDGLNPMSLEAEIGIGEGWMARVRARYGLREMELRILMGRWNLDHLWSDAA